MQFWWNEILGEQPNPVDNQLVSTIDFGGAYPLLIETWLTQVGSQNNNFASNAYVQIIQVVQNGNPITGTWHTYSGEGISSVTFRLTVNNCRAFATCRALAIDE